MQGPVGTQRLQVWNQIVGTDYRLVAGCAGKSLIRLTGSQGSERPRPLRTPRPVTPRSTVAFLGLLKQNS